MTVDLFNKRYGEKGGIYKLLDMKSNLATLKQISEHFGVGKERVRQWMVDLTGEKYDPRFERRSRRIEEISMFLKGLDPEQRKKYQKMVGKDYYKKAMEKLGIYL